VANSLSTTPVPGLNPDANIDLISHSWGTTLTYDLQNRADIPNRHWVTMGSPLKSSTPKPPGNTGNWINCYSVWDPVIHFEVYPPFPGVVEMAVGVLTSPLTLGRVGAGLTADPNVTPGMNLPYTFSGIWVHSDYWTDQMVLSDLRRLMQ